MLESTYITVLDALVSEDVLAQRWVYLLVLYLVEIVKLASHSDISVTSNVSGLLGAQHKLKRGLLKSAAPLSYKRSWFQQFPMDIIEWQVFKFNIDCLCQSFGRGACLETLLSICSCQGSSLRSI